MEVDGGDEDVPKNEEEEQSCNQEEDQDGGEWRLATSTDHHHHHHHHAHIVTVMTSGDDLGGGHHHGMVGGSSTSTTTAAFVPVTFDTGGRLGGPGEVRLIQVPISMLPPNFHFLHSTQGDEEEDGTTTATVGVVDDEQQGQGQVQELGDDEEGLVGLQEDHLAVTLVATTTQDSVGVPNPKDIHDSVVIQSQHEAVEISGDTAATSLLVGVDDPTGTAVAMISEDSNNKSSLLLPSLRSRRSRPIRKHAYNSSNIVKEDQDRNKQFASEDDKGTSITTTGKGFVGPKWPEDKCANCAVEFQDDGTTKSEDTEGNSSQKNSNANVIVKKSSSLRIREEETEEEVLNHEALQYVFNIKLGRGKELSSSSSNNEPPSYCWLCQDCSKVLEDLYVACRAFTKLTKEEAFLYKRLRTKVIQVQQKHHQTAQDDPGNSQGNAAAAAAVDESQGEKIEVKVELHDFGGDDDEDEEWITADLSDDEDFRASPTDLEKAEISSDSSYFEPGDQYHHHHHHHSHKRKSKSNTVDLMGSIISPKKKRSSKSSNNKTRSGGDSFWWDSNNKTDSDDDDFSLGFYTKRNKKLRVKKSLLAGITYDCSACETTGSGGASFPTPRELKVHLRECHRESGVVSEVEAAETNTIRTDGGSEIEVKATATSCRLCSFEVFPSVQEFKTHWAKEHSEDKISSSEVLPYECFTCKKTFVEWTALIKHRVTHNLQKPYKCRLCGESWRRADELQVHWSRNHAQDFITDSNNTTNTAGSDGSLSKKDETLPPKRREAVPCSVCGKSFMRHDHLKLHMRIHTGEKPFPCPTCGKAFSDPRGLAYHEVTHSSERPYCCTVCGMTFKRLHHLNDHERNHATDVARPFSCELCGKAFKYKKHLNSHSVIHGNSKDHSCEICHKAFNRKDNLRQHVKKVHGKEPGPDTMSSGSGGGSSNVVHHSLVVASLERGEDEDDVLVGDEPEVSISEEGTVRSGHVEVPTATAIPIVTGSAGESLAVDHIVYMAL